jgi:transcriptional regulator with XRE-family HTH domain
MKTMKTSFQKILSAVPADIQQEIDMEVAISNRINDLMEQRGLSKLEFAQALDKRPSEVTKWLSGQHNFTIRTISLLSSFFGESIIEVSHGSIPYEPYEPKPLVAAEP